MQKCKIYLYNSFAYFCYDCERISKCVKQHLSQIVLSLVSKQNIIFSESNGQNKKQIYKKKRMLFWTQNNFVRIRIKISSLCKNVLKRKTDLITSKKRHIFAHF